MATEEAIGKWLYGISRLRYQHALVHLRDDQDVNVRGFGGVTALHVVASEGGLLKTIKRLLLDGADLDARNDQGETPLRLAQRYGDSETIRYMLTHQALLGALARHLGRVPLPAEIRSAVYNKSMRWLRDDVTRTQATQTARLIAAAREGDLETVKAMVEEDGGVSVDAVDSATEETALSVALARGHRSLYEYLIARDAHGYAPCIVGGKKQTTVVTAVSSGDVDLVRRLVVNGAPLSSRKYDVDACTLELAASMGSIEMINALLELGAKFQNDRLGRMELPYGIGSILQLNPHYTPWRVLRSKLDLRWPHHDAIKHRNLRDDETPWWHLCIACWHGDMPLVQHLFASHEELQGRDFVRAEGAARALFLAVYGDHEDIVAELLDRGVSINQPVNGGMTAISAAVLNGRDSVRMLRLLLAGRYLVSVANLLTVL